MVSPKNRSIPKGRGISYATKIQFCFSFFISKTLPSIDWTPQLLFVKFLKQLDSFKSKEIKLPPHVLKQGDYERRFYVFKVLPVLLVMNNKMPEILYKSV